MTRVLLVVVAVLLGVLVARPYIDRALLAERQPRAIEARGDLAEYERSSVGVFERVAPSVVQVVAGAQGGGRGGPAGPTGTGTGFVWDQAGHIVTNAHVVEGHDRVVVRFADGEIAPARVEGRSPNHDLAVLRLERSVTLPPPIPLGGSSELKVGQVAYAIGNPFGLDQSLTMGIISALKRRLPTSGGREIPDVIQTDAAINPGNSGGPLLDSAGRLIGVNTAIFSPSGANAGIGFAIPVDVVNRIVPALIRDGRVPTPGIGILAADEEIAARLGVTGVVIADVRPGSPADRAGLVGAESTGSLADVIVAVDGAPVRRLADLTERLERAGIGREVALTVRRGERTQQVRLQIVDIGRL